MADIQDPLKYGRVVGKFQYVVADSTDTGDAPDILDLRGTVRFTPSYRNVRVTDPDPAKRKIVYLDTIEASVRNGVLVDKAGNPGVSLLANTGATGSVTPYDISWNAEFFLEKADGTTLSPQPESTWMSVSPDQTVILSDFLPSKVDTKNVEVTSIDRSTVLEAQGYLKSMQTLVSQVQTVLDKGEIKGDQGATGPAGPAGPTGPMGTQGPPGAFETFNYVINPVPTSNNGYKGINGTVSINGTNDALVFTASTSTTAQGVLYSVLTPATPSVPMYIRYVAKSSIANATLSTVAMFMNASGKVIDTVKASHVVTSTDSLGILVTSPAERVVSVGAVSDADVSYVVFTMGFDSAVPAGSTLTVSKIILSNTPDQYFSGSSTIAGYDITWRGTANASYSVKRPNLSQAAGVVSSISVNGETAMTGNVTLSKTSLGLGSVDNTSDANKPVSTAVQNALDTKLGATSFTGYQDKPSGYDQAYFPIIDVTSLSAHVSTSAPPISSSFTDIGYSQAPIAGYTMGRAAITSVSSTIKPVIQLSNDGNTWVNWVELEGAAASSVRYTDISMDYDKTTDSMVVLIGKVVDGQTPVKSLELYRVSKDKSITKATISSGTTMADFRSPSVVSSLDGTGPMTIFLVDSTNKLVKKTVSSNNVLSASLGSYLTSVSEVKVFRLYRTYVATSVTSAGISLFASPDGVTWTQSTNGTPMLPATAGSVLKASAFPGVSAGHTGIYIDYLGSSGLINRVFAHTGVSHSGTVSLAGLAAAGSDSTTVKFPAPTAFAPTVVLSCNDPKTIVSLSGTPSTTGFSFTRYNVGSTTSGATVISWIAQR